MKDKVMFWLDGALTHFCIAYYFQKKYDCDLFAIIDITNKAKKFFQEQKLVAFQKSWYYHDHIKIDETNPDLDYLSYFEKKYNINLRQLAINERIFYRFNRIYKFSDHEILKVLEQECKLFESILDEIKPDFLITKEPPLHHHELFYQMCRAKGIRVLIINHPNFGRCVISTEPRKLDDVVELKNLDATGRNFTDLQNYRKLFNVSAMTEGYKNRVLSSKSGKLKAAIEFLFRSNNSNVKTHYTYFGRSKWSVLIDSIKFSLKKKYRHSFINKNLLTEIDFSEPFVYFPLALDEERNLLISTPFYTNQIEIIRHIVKSLPIGFKLYVKEHPSESIRGWRSISDYKEIMDIPNVHLIHPSVSAEKLYENCSLVITVGGTAGFDATFYGKPSIIFADLGYSILPSVHRIKTLEELPSAIRLSLETKVDPTDLDKYLVFLEKQTFEFDLSGFTSKYHNHFYYGGHLVDVEITMEKMKSFLEENKIELEQVAEEHIKKIKHSKELQI